jgi:hypothetical protein
MARSKQTSGKRVTAGKALRKKPIRKVRKALTTRKKYRFKPGSKLISRKISIYTNWIYSLSSSRNQKISEEY